MRALGWMLAVGGVTALGVGWVHTHPDTLTAQAATATWHRVEQRVATQVTRQVHRVLHKAVAPSAVYRPRHPRRPRHPDYPPAYTQGGWQTYYLQDAPYFAEVHAPIRTGGSWTGTAWIGAQGHVLTCWHVIRSTLQQGTATAPVTITPDNPVIGSSGSVSSGGVIPQVRLDAHEGWGYVDGINRLYDLARIHVASWPYRAPGGLAWNTHPVWVGEPVVAIGYPGGGNTLGWEGGKILGLQKIVNVTTVGLETDLFTSAWTTGGDSGGVLLNPWNQVLGVLEAANYNPAASGASGGSGYAIPIHAARGIQAIPVAPSALHNPVPWWNHL